MGATPDAPRTPPSLPSRPFGILLRSVPPSDQRYQGLLVDWGGVLTSNLFDSFSAFCHNEGLEPDIIRRSFREDPKCRQLLIDFETGELEEADFEPQFAAVLGVQPRDLIDRLFAGSHPDLEMLAGVEAARAAGIRTGLISNSWGTRRYDREVLERLFEGVVLSGEVGIRKPATEIYLMGARSIGLEPAVCVFVDDLPFNLPPAAEIGMGTVHHTNASETIAELERLFGIELK